MPPVRVRPLEPSDVDVTSRLHEDVLSMEFLATCGRGFLRRYHRAWIETDHAIALGALDDAGHLVGVLLGTVYPSEHFRTMVRRHGIALGAHLVLQALRRPRFARTLVATRAKRYVRGLWRIARSSIASRLRHPRASSTRSARGATPPAERAAGAGGHLGEVTHLMVSPDAQGHGAGRALLREAQRIAAAAGVEELVVVTPPDLAAVSFYEHLGWIRSGELMSRSGEPFVRFRFPLGGDSPPGRDASG